jgi:hypothetical protein
VEQETRLTEDPEEDEREDAKHLHENNASSYQVHDVWSSANTAVAVWEALLR